MTTSAELVEFLSHHEVADWKSLIENDDISSLTAIEALLHLCAELTQNVLDPDDSNLLESNRKDFAGKMFRFEFPSNDFCRKTTSIHGHAYRFR